MNHPISLMLEVPDQGPWGLHLRLTVRNESGVDLLFPTLEDTGLHFGNVLTMCETGCLHYEFYHSPFVYVFTLRPGQSTSIEWSVRPRRGPDPNGNWGVEPLEWPEKREGWCEVDLPSGDYLVWYKW